MNTCGVINYTTGRTQLSIILLVVGVFAIGGIALFHWWIIHKRFVQRREAKKKRAYKGVASIGDFVFDQE